MLSKKDGGCDGDADNTGEVLFISAFNPQYWLFEKGARVEKTIKLEAGGEA